MRKTVRAQLEAAIYSFYSFGGDFSIIGMAGIGKRTAFAQEPAAKPKCRFQTKAAQQLRQPFVLCLAVVER